MTACTVVLAIVAACAVATEHLMRDVRPTPESELRATHLHWS
jgi:hypothetical protein